MLIVIGTNDNDRCDDDQCYQVEIPHGSGMSATTLAALSMLWRVLLLDQICFPHKNTMFVTYL